MTNLKAPFPYFGGKSTIANLVWQTLGNVKHYIEPFFGSGAVLLARPNYDPTTHVETINDADGFVCNVWRALQASPDEVARWCDWPVNHADLTARKKVLIENEPELLRKLCESDEFYNAKLAGYWIWATSCWIGSGLTSPTQRPHIGTTGKGVHKLSQRPHISHAGKGVKEPYNTNLYAWFRQLSERLRYVRVVCGDWTRVCGGNWQDKIGTVGIFFDPPYGEKATRDNGIYHKDSLSVADDVRQWCVERGDKPTYRIVLAGYMEEHIDELTARGWSVYQWKANSGYSNVARKNKGQNKNRFRECLFLSPHCLKTQLEFS